MSDKELDIQISIEQEIPDIQLSISENNPEIEFAVESGGDTHETYDGEYEVDPKFFEDTVLNTKNKVMIKNVTVNEIRVEKVTSPTGGYVYYIGL